MSLVIDFPQVESASIASQDTTGAPFETLGVVIPVVVPQDEIASLLAAYDPNNQYSPPAAESRVIARLVLDALAAFESP